MRKKKILFVDDDNMATAIWRITLQRAEFEVTPAFTIDDAWNFYRTGMTSDSKFDLIVLDIMMHPGSFSTGNEEGLTTGVEFLKRLRKGDGTTPVIVLTNVDDQGILDSAEAFDRVTVRSKVTELPSLLVETVKEQLG